MKRALITGAGGFVGQYLVRELEEQGEVKVTTSAYSPSTDLTDFAYVNELIQTERPDVVYNLAAISRVERTVEDTAKIITNNSLLTSNLLEATRLHSPHARFVAISSGNVYGLVKQDEAPITESQPLKPLNAYAVSKISQEYLSLQYHYAHGLDVVILRPFNHTGPGQTDQFVIPALAKQFAAHRSGGMIKVGNLDTARDFTDVRDMVKAYVLAAENCVSGQTYNIGSGRALPILEIVKLLQKISGSNAAIVEDKGSMRASDVPLLVADYHKFELSTGWSPTIPLEQTLTDVLQYWQEGK